MTHYATSCLAFLRSKKVADQYKIWANMDPATPTPKRVVQVPPPITSDTKALILLLHSRGMTFIDISVQAKCHPNTVSKYIKRHAKTQEAQ